MCVLHKAPVTCPCAVCVQSLISSVLLNAKPSTETHPLFSGLLDQCLCLKSIPTQIKLNVGVINPYVCAERRVCSGACVKLVQREMTAYCFSLPCCIWHSQQHFSNPAEIIYPWASFLPGSWLSWLTEERMVEMAQEMREGWKHIGLPPSYVT